ncbi:MAG: sensor histidine kinase [Vampirovibrionales bacterium]
MGVAMKQGILGALRRFCAKSFARNAIAGKLTMTLLVGFGLFFAGVSGAIYTVIAWRIHQEDTQLFQELGQWLVTETLPAIQSETFAKPKVQHIFHDLLLKELHAFQFHHYLVRLTWHAPHVKDPSKVIYVSQGFPPTSQLAHVPMPHLVTGRLLPQHIQQVITPSFQRGTTIVPAQTWLAVRFYKQEVGYELLYNITSHQVFLNVLAETLAGVLCVGLCFMIVLIQWVIQRSFVPLYTFSQQIHQVSHPQDFLAQPRLPWPQEIQPLAEAFRRMMERLNTHLETLTHFSSHLAHELKTPLASLRLNTEVLLSQERSVSDYQRGLEHQLEACEQLTTLVERLLLLAHMDSPRHVLSCQWFPLSPLVRRLADYYTLMAEEQSLTLHFEVPEALVLYADESWVSMVVSNLLSNAMKYNRPGGEVRLQAYTQAEGVWIQLQDTGVGISEEDQPHVLERFYRADKAHSQTIKGTGLGLALVSAIMAKHRGTLVLESQEGQGTMVRVWFPHPSKEESG